MKLITSNTRARILLLFAAGVVQGCSQSGDDGAASDSALEAAAKSSGAPNQSATAQDATGPIVVLHPASGPSGSTVSVMGKGFDGACAVNLFLDSLDGAVLGTGTVLDDGTFSEQVIVPEAVEEGAHPVIAEGQVVQGEFCTEPSGVTSDAEFTVTGRMPLITLADLEGRPGTTVEVEGRGFCAAAECSAVTVLIDGQVGASDVTVGEDGTFVADVSVPAIDAAGAVAVVAVQTDAEGMQLRAFGELTVTVEPPTEPSPPVQ